ncbi:MAG TPA: helix-turn-helix domain-containing protein [Nitrososphaeraceae archaeon]|nr:helix-turn-helix domain-containing protein [Nitrososphaeraceae archaeon]
MRITKQKQIEARRARVLELSAQGLTQEEIAKKLVAVSQKTVSNDLAWWKEESIVYIKNSGEHIALEYRKVLSNFYQLRKSAWEWFNKPDIEKDTKLALYHTLEHINGDIMDLLAAGDMIKLEDLEQQKQYSEGIRKELDEMRVRSEDGRQSSAVF